VRNNPVSGNQQRGKYGHSNEADITEYEDSPEVLDEKIDILVKLLKNADHAVVYTGAGISTAAKIPDYRGPSGAWTRMEKGLAPPTGVPIEQALPTVAHRALAALIKEGIFKFIVSTNLDGLHRRSGIAARDLSELHGNCYLEYCSTCGAEYMRTFDVVSGGQKADHSTGRNCEREGCSGPLKDSIVNFGESLPPREYNKANTASKKCGLALVLGSSMLVKPACELPLISYKRNKGKLVIVNLQKTAYDEDAWMHIFATCDAVMQKVMDKLSIPIPEEIVKQNV